MLFCMMGSKPTSTWGVAELVNIPSNDIALKCRWPPGKVADLCSVLCEACETSLQRDEEVAGSGE